MEDLKQQNHTLDDVATVSEEDANADPELKDDELMEQAAKAIDENEKLQEEINQLKQENESLKVKISELEKQNKSLEEEIAKLKNQDTEKEEKTEESKEFSAEAIVEGILNSEIFKKTIEETVKNIYDPVISEIKEMLNKKNESTTVTTEGINKVEPPTAQFLNETKDDENKFKTKQEFEKELLELARQLISEI